jgi:hypothetical protein
VALPRGASRRLLRTVAEQDRLFRPHSIVIEDRASGTQLIEEVAAQQRKAVADEIAALNEEAAACKEKSSNCPKPRKWPSPENQH